MALASLTACISLVRQVSTTVGVAARHAGSWGAWAAWRLLFMYLLPHAIIADWVIDLTVSALSHCPRLCHWLDHSRCTIAAVFASWAPLAAILEAVALPGCSLCVCKTASHEHSEYMYGSGGEAFWCLMAAFMDFSMQLASAAAFAASASAQILAWVASSRGLAYLWAVIGVAWVVG
jgi:hypothetical protein